MFAIPLILAVAAQAEEPAPAERATELYANGVRLYEEGNYDAAIVSFRSAYDLVKAPEMHFNISNCYERLGKLEEAIAELNLYRAVAPAEEQDTLSRRLTAMEARLAEQKAAAAANVVTPTPVLVPTPTPTPATVTKRSPRWWMVGLGTAIAGVGGVGAGVTYTRGQQEIEQNEREEYETFHSLNGLSWGLGGLGVVLAGVGFVATESREVPITAIPATDDSSSASAR